MKEQEIQRAILDWLDLSGIVHWRVMLAAVPVAGGKFFRKNPMKGWPDIGGVIPGGNGRLFAVEVKQPTKAKWYPEQLEWKAKLTNAGVLYVTATSVEDVKRALQEAG